MRLQPFRLPWETVGAKSGVSSAVVAPHVLTGLLSASRRTWPQRPGPGRQSPWSAGPRPRLGFQRCPEGHTRPGTRSSLLLRDRRTDRGTGRTRLPWGAASSRERSLGMEIKLTSGALGKST